MSIHLQSDLQDLHKDLLSMCAIVEDMIHRAVNQLASPNQAEVQMLIDEDHRIDRWDVRIEDNCLKLLALHQPVAIDLRRITTVLKISGEIERVGDIATHIAERACGLADTPDVEIPDQMKQMARDAVDMLHRSIDAYVDLDSEKARQVIQDDDRIDKMDEMLIGSLIEQMHAHPERLDALLHQFSASRQIERVGDHASNIAEDVVYLVEGKIIRHSSRS